MRADSRRYTGLDIFGLLDAGWFGPSSEPDQCQSVHDSAASGELDGSEPASHKAIVRTVSQQGADGPVKSAEVSRQGSLTPPVTAEQHLKLPSTDFFRTRKISKAPQLTVHAYSDWQGASLPVTTPRRKNTVTTPKQGSRRASLDELPGFGSWAQRQFRFQPQSAFATEEAEVERPSTPTLGTSHRGNTCNTMRTSETDDEDAARQAAWRWRFNRRWANEQSRQLGPRPTDDDEQDNWDEALGFLDACGPVSRGHIARTVSAEHGLGASLRSHGSGLSGGWLEESQREGLLKEHADMDATRAVAAVARRAQDLFRQQQQIEREVEQRWDSTRGGAWVGGHMPAASMDKFGRCPFVLARVAERGTGPQRLLIRSAQDCSPQRLFADVSVEAQHVRAAHNLPPVKVELLGAGSLHWAGGRDNSVSVHPGSTTDAKRYSVDDVARLAANVLRGSLPMHQRITVAVTGMMRT